MFNLITVFNVIIGFFFGVTTLINCKPAEKKCPVRVVGSSIYKLPSPGEYDFDNSTMTAVSIIQHKEENDGLEKSKKEPKKSKKSGGGANVTTAVEEKKSRGTAESLHVAETQKTLKYDAVVSTQEISPNSVLSRTGVSKSTVKKTQSINIP